MRATYYAYPRTESDSDPGRAYRYPERDRDLYPAADCDRGTRAHARSAGRTNLHANLGSNLYRYVNFDSTAHFDRDSTCKCHRYPLPHCDSSAANYPTRRGIRAVFATDRTLTFFPLDTGACLATLPATHFLTEVSRGQQFSRDRRPPPSTSELTHSYRGHLLVTIGCVVPNKSRAGIDI